VLRRRRVDKRRPLLTLDRDMMLVLGPHPVRARRPCPEPGSEEWGALRACWERYRYGDDGEDRYGEGSWGYLAFELGDVEAAGPLAGSPPRTPSSSVASAIDASAQAPPFTRGCRTKGLRDKHPEDAQIATGAAGQAARRMSPRPTRPRLPGLLTPTETRSYWPGWGLCDSLTRREA
jgi:hypothetical protein